MNDTYWDVNKGPILFYAGNEGRIEDFCENSVSFEVNISTLTNNEALNVRFRFKVHILLSIR